MQTLKQNSIFAKSVDIIYEFSKNEIERQGIKTLEKIYQNTSWIDSYKMDFYKTKENHKKHIEDAFDVWSQHSNVEWVLDTQKILAIQQWADKKIIETESAIKADNKKE